MSVNKLDIKTVKQIADELQALLIKRPFVLVKYTAAIQPEQHEGLWLIQPVVANISEHVSTQNGLLILADTLEENDPIKIEIYPIEGGSAVADINLALRYAYIAIRNSTEKTETVYLFQVNPDDFPQM